MATAPRGADQPTVSTWAWIHPGTAPEGRAACPEMGWRVDPMTYARRESIVCVPFFSCCSWRPGPPRLIGLWC